MPLVVVHSYNSASVDDDDVQDRPHHDIEGKFSGPQGFAPSWKAHRSTDEKKPIREGQTQANDQQVVEEARGQEKEVRELAQNRTRVHDCHHGGRCGSILSDQIYSTVIRFGSIQGRSLFLSWSRPPMLLSPALRRSSFIIILRYSQEDNDCDADIHHARSSRSSLLLFGCKRTIFLCA